MSSLMPLDQLYNGAADAQGKGPRGTLISATVEIYTTLGMSNVGVTQTIVILQTN